MKKIITTIGAAILLSSTAVATNVTTFSVTPVNETISLFDDFIAQSPDPYWQVEDYNRVYCTFLREHNEYAENYNIQYDSEDIHLKTYYRESFDTLINFFGITIVGEKPPVGNIICV